MTLNNFVNQKVKNVCWEWIIKTLSNVIDGDYFPVYSSIYYCNNLLKQLTVSLVGYVKMLATLFAC